MWRIAGLPVGLENAADGEIYETKAKKHFTVSENNEL